MMSFCVEQSASAESLYAFSFFLFAVVVYITERQLNIHRERANTIPNLLGRIAPTLTATATTKTKNETANHLFNPCSHLPTPF
jgi:hypothetical protein